MGEDTRCEISGAKIPKKCCENCKYLFQVDHVICDILVTSTLQAKDFFCAEHKFKDDEE